MILNNFFIEQFSTLDSKKIYSYIIKLLQINDNLKENKVFIFELDIFLGEKDDRNSIIKYVDNKQLKYRRIFEYIFVYDKIYVEGFSFKFR